MTLFIHFSNIFLALLEQEHLGALKARTSLAFHRVGGWITPATSHTTGRTVPYHGGSRMN